MRGVRPGSIQSAVQAAIRATGGLECASADIGVSVTNLSRASSCEDDRPGGLGINHLDRLGRIVPASAVPLAEHFAHLAGGVFQPMVHDGSLATDISDLTAEFADVLAVYAVCMSERSKLPHDFTTAEAQATLKEVDDLLRVCARLRGSLLLKAGGG